MIPLSASSIQELVIFPAHGITSKQFCGTCNFCILILTNMFNVYNRGTKGIHISKISFTQFTSIQWALWQTKVFYRIQKAEGAPLLISQDHQNWSLRLFSSGVSGPFFRKLSFPRCPDFLVSEIVVYFDSWWEGIFFILSYT